MRWKPLAGVVFLLPLSAFTSYAGPPTQTIRLQSGKEQTYPAFLQFSPKGKTLLVGDNFGNVYGFETTKWRKISVWAFGADEFVEGVLFDRRGRTALVGWGNCQVSSVPLSKGATGRIQQLPVIVQPQDVSTTYMAMAPNGRFVAISSLKLDDDLNVIEKNVIEVFDPRTRRRLGAFQLPGQSNRVAFRPDSKEFAAIVERKKVAIYDTRAWKPKHQVAVAAEFLTYSPDGQTLLVAPCSNSFSLINLKEKSVREFKTPGDVYALAWAPDGKTFVVAGAGNKPRNFLWICDSATGKVLHKLQPSLQYRVVSVAFTPDGKWLAAGGIIFDKIDLWELSKVGK